MRRLISGFHCALRPALCALLLAACASAPPPAANAPEWDVIPAGVLEALCTRMKMDGLASGSSLAIVKTTQPIATAHAYAALGRSVGKRPTSPAQPGKSIPIDVGGSCPWTPIDAFDANRHADTMIIELSSPVPNPFVAGAAGVFARTSLGGQHPSWYWIGLIPRPGGWSIGSLTAIDAM